MNNFFGHCWQEMTEGNEFSERRNMKPFPCHLLPKNERRKGNPKK